MDNLVVYHLPEVSFGHILYLAYVLNIPLLFSFYLYGSKLHYIFSIVLNNSACKIEKSVYTPCIQ